LQTAPKGRKTSLRMDVDLILINGERRRFVVPGHSGSVASVLDRLDEWVEIKGGGWVRKSFIVEVRPVAGGNREEAGTAEELRQLTDAASSLADQVDT
jgi:hypothetical protein